MTVPGCIAAPLLGRGSRGSVVFGALNSYGDETDLTTYTFSNSALGAPAEDRRIVANIIGVQAAPVGTISAVTIGGVAAAFVLGQTDTTNQRRLEMWQAAVPLGATGDVVVTWGTGQQGCRVDVVPMYGATGTAFDTASSNAAPPSDTIDIPANGACIAGCISNGGTVTWTGLTERSDNVTASVGLSSAFDSFTAPETGRSIAPSPNTAAGAGLVAASWRPA